MAEHVLSGPEQPELVPSEREKQCQRGNHMQSIATTT